MSDTVAARRAATIIALLAGGAVTVQLLLNVTVRGQDVGTALFNLFGYFTIWSNTAVVLVAGRAALRPGADVLARPQVQAAVVTWIIVVGVIYNTLLIDLNPVAGMRWWTDRIMHMVVPVAWPLWWLTFRARARLAWRHLPTAMIVPTLYCLYSLGKGQVTGKYPYFFLDVAKLGWPHALLNIAGLVALFVALMAGAITLDRRSQQTLTA